VEIDDILMVYGRHAIAAMEYVQSIGNQSSFLLIPFVSFLLCCQKTMLIMTNAIPTGRKNMLLLTAVTIMKRIPLIEKSIAAVL